MLPRGGDQEPRLDRHTYVQLTVVRLFQNLPLMLLAALLFSLAALPATALLSLKSLLPAIVVGALSLAPAWAALLAHEAPIGLGKTASIRTMLLAFPRYWGRAARLGMLGAFPLSMLALTLPSLGMPEVPFIVWLGLAADLFGVALLAALYLYAFPLLVLHDQPVGLALRNAWILASRHVGSTAGLLSMGVLFGLAIALIGPLLAIFLPAVWGLFVVNNAQVVLSEHPAERTGG